MSNRGLGGEVGWWCPSLNDSASDLSGNGYNGTYNGGMGTVSDTGSGGVRAYSLDGSNDSISVAHNTALAPASAGSWSLWVKSNTTNTEYYVVDKALNTAGMYALILRNDATIAAYIRASGLKAVTGISYSSGTWMHLAWVWSTAANSAVLYKNGVSVGSVSLAGNTPTDGTLGVVLGDTTEAAHARYLNGYLDDVRLFNRALTQAEVTFLFGNGYGRGKQRTLPATTMEMAV